MELNVKRSDCRFYVDEAHRKVVCVIPNTRELMHDYLEDTKFWSVLGRWNSRINREMELPSSFTGIATCHESDTFDVETGKLIAFNKAKHKLNTSFFKRANKFVNICDTKLGLLIDEFNVLGERLSANANKREQLINERLGVEDTEE